MVSNDTRSTLKEKLCSTTSPWDRLPILIGLAQRPEDTDPDFAHRCGVEALNLAKELDDRFWIACSLSAIGTCLMRTGRYSEILYYLERASRMFERLNNPLLKARTDFSIATVYLLTRDVARAYPLVSQNLHLFGTADLPEWRARSLAQLGDIHRSAGEYGKAIEHYRRAVALAAESENEARIGEFYLQLATFYRGIGDGAQHSAYLFKALDLHRKHGNREGIAMAMEEIGAMYIEGGEFDRAEPYIRESVEIYRELGCIAREAGSWGKMSIIGSMRGDFVAALHSWQTGLTISRGCEDRMVSGELHNARGLLCFQKGDMPEALRHLLKALRIMEEEGERFSQHLIHKLIGQTYEELGDAENALKHYREHLEVQFRIIGIRKCYEAAGTEAQPEVRRLSAEIHEEQSKRAVLREQIIEKEARLASLALQLVREEESRRRVKAKGQEWIRQKEEPSTESWDVFARQFHKVHHGFYPDLVRRYPTLTPTEVKICSLIKAGLSSKEIAGILSISKRTVDNHRVNIHRKMVLPPGTSLSGFIARM